MIFDAQSYSLIFQDRIYSLAIGFVTGFVNQLLAVFLYKGKIKVFIRDILISFFFTVAIFSYSVSFANYNILRWYNVAFALLGAVLFTPCFSTTVNMIFRLAGVTAGYGIKRAARYTAAAVNKARSKKEKKQKFTPENNPELLQRDEVLLYN